MIYTVNENFKLISCSGGKTLPDTGCVLKYIAAGQCTFMLVYEFTSMLCRPEAAGTMKECPNLLRMRTSAAARPAPATVRRPCQRTAQSYLMLALSFPLAYGNPSD